MIINENVEQGSEAWFKLRKGRATASRFKDILTPTGKQSASAIKYMRELSRECLVDNPLEFIGNKYTDWGNTHEPDARALFAERTGFDVREVGFVTRDDAVVGCSPDGLIYDYDGQPISGLEIKCPQPDKHVEHVMGGELPKDYKLQVHGSMAVTGFNDWWFMSYFPGLEPLIIRVERDDFTEKVESALDQFVIDYAEERQRVLDAVSPKSEKEEIA